MVLDYFCTSCGLKTTNQEMESMLCKCGGELHLDNGFNTSRPFDAGYCDTLKCEVTSWKDQEKKMRNHRSRSHPQGFTPIQDNKKWLAELKNIRKHKEDYKQSTLPGYKPGKYAKKAYDHIRPDKHDVGRRVYSYSK